MGYAAAPGRQIITAQPYNQYHPLASTKDAWITARVFLY